jgi:hypothetical protein
MATLDSATYSITYAGPPIQGGGADSATYPLTYSGVAQPIESAGTDSIGQHCAVMKAIGNDSGGSMHFAMRTTGPYSLGDGDIIRAGTGAIFTILVANLPRQSVLVTGLDSGTAHYWGVTFDEGGAASTGQFTTKTSPADEQGISPEGIQP